MKVAIKSWVAVATWRWDLREDDDCGICQAKYDATCPDCKFPGDGCPPVSGVCKHTFHSHCLRKWVSQDSAQGRCPMCRQPFKDVLDAASADPQSVPSSDSNARPGSP